ncbi:hypothetical protein KFE25_008741 [Diacronema lutheri]|uniref:Transcription factor Iwr1 domain-containing protein n=1 Tax=Diacronema lutheri TaxID=2081491 RepID=A0A8J5Y2Q0_DIALT|nr:hypothetical protein KFE25_008741 [Diacronema lutheri]
MDGAKTDDDLRIPHVAQTLLRVKRPRDAPIPASLRVFNDAPAQQRVSMARLHLQRDGVGPTVRRYRLVAAGAVGVAAPAHPLHHPSITTSSKAAFAAHDRRRLAVEHRAHSFRYRCVQERRMAPAEVQQHIGSGAARFELSAGKVRMLDLELKPVTAKLGARPAAIIPFGPPAPPATSERVLASGADECSDEPGADAFAYDVYMADDSSGASTTSDAVLYIEYAEDEAQEEDFRSDGTNSDVSTDDSNAEGHYANDYPDSEASSEPSTRRDMRFHGDAAAVDDADADDADADDADDGMANLRFDADVRVMDMADPRFDDDSTKNDICVDVDVDDIHDHGDGFEVDDNSGLMAATVR